MSTDETALRERLAGVIAGHQRIMTQRGGPCWCGEWPNGLRTPWMDHVADALLPVVAQEVAAARAEVVAKVETVCASLERLAGDCRDDQRDAEESAEAEYWAGAADHLWPAVRDLRAALGGDQ